MAGGMDRCQDTRWLVWKQRRCGGLVNSLQVSFSMKMLSTSNVIATSCDQLNTTENVLRNCYYNSPKANLSIWADRSCGCIDHKSSPLTQDQCRVDATYQTNATLTPNSNAPPHISIN